MHCRSQVERAQAALEVVRACGREGALLQFDLRDRESARRAIEEDMTAHGVYYGGVVCNAGAAHDAPFPALTGEAWDSVIQTNLTAFTMCCSR